MGSGGARTRPEDWRTQPKQAHRSTAMPVGARSSPRVSARPNLTAPFAPRIDADRTVASRVLIR